MSPGASEPAAAPAFAAEALTVRRGGRTVLRDVSFGLGAGGALVVAGRNGAGKSTLLRALAGLLPPASGRVTARGAAGPLVLAEAVHYLGHLEGLKGWLTAAENLALAAALLGGTGEGATPESALDALGLRGLADLPVAYLSAGQRRRVAIGRLLVAPRPVWLLDEPATALDAGARATLARLMAAHRAGGGMVVAATHAPLGLEDAAVLELGPQPEGGAP